MLRCPCCSQSEKFPYFSTGTPRQWGQNLEKSHFHFTLERPRLKTFVGKANDRFFLIDKILSSLQRNLLDNFLLLDN